MDKVQLLFEGHLSEAIAPQVFRILDPFEIDSMQWMRENACSGKTVYVLQGKAVAFTTGTVGVNYLHKHKEDLNVHWEEVYASGNPMGIGGIFL